MLSRNVAFFLLLLLTACGGGSDDSNNIFDPPVIQRGSLVSSTLLATNSSSFLIPYSVDAYRIIYNTVDTNNNSIKASGLLGVPKKGSGGKSPLISYQHGTIFLDSQAPSNSSTSAEPIMILAGTGYIVSAPDYLGYGESSNLIHPYLHADSLASASIDMLKASTKFLQDQSVNTNGQLFLAGYSEGGYATLALQKAIQESGSNEFNVSASAAGAGPFDLSETAKMLANQAINERPAYMSFLLKAYDSIYGLDQVSGMYQPQYVNTINTSFDGQHSGGTINSNLTTSTQDLFETMFLNTLQGASSDNVAAKAIEDKLALNNIYNWKPDVPTRFYHSPIDEIVPYSNAQKALSTMIANGANNVSLGDCPLGEHGLCAIPYVFDTINFFNSYVTDL